MNDLATKTPKTDFLGAGKRHAQRIVPKANVGKKI